MLRIGDKCAFQDNGRTNSGVITGTERSGANTYYRVRPDRYCGYCVLVSAKSTAPMACSETPRKRA